MYNSYLNNLQFQNQKYLVQFLFAVFVIFLFIMGHILEEMVQPLVLGVFFAYTINPIITYLEKKGYSFAKTIPIVSVALIAIILVVAFYFYLSIYYFLFDGNRYDFYVDKITVYSQFIINHLKDYKMVGPEFNLTKALSKHQATLKDAGINFILSAGSWVSFFGLIIFYTLLFLVGIKSFRVKAFRSFNRKKAIKVVAINNKIIEQVQQYMLTKATLSAIAGSIVFIDGLIFGIDLYLFWAILTFLLNFIPRFGAIFAIVPPMILSILQFDSLYMIAGFNIGLILAQVVVGYYFEPQMFAKRFSLSSLALFFGLIFWGWYWGVVGVFLAVPIMVSAVIFCKNIPSLRSIAVFLNSAYPLKEDEERLSLMLHIINTDKLFDDKEKAKIQEEFSKEIYDSLFMEGYWDSIQKNPLGIEEIFATKTDGEKILLYQLALQWTLLNDNIDKAEVKLLMDIKKIANIHSDAIKNLIMSVQLSHPEQAGLVDLLNDVTNDKTDIDKYNYNEQLAYSLEELGKKYFELDRLDKSKEHSHASLKYFILIEEQDKIDDLIKTISSIDILLSNVVTA